MKYISLYLLLGMYLLFSALSASAESEPFIVYTEELEPVHYTEQGKITGIATEIVQAIFAEADVKATFKSFPWKRSFFYAQHNDNSFIYTINRTPEREKQFHWIGPILPKRTYLFRLKTRNDIKVNKPEDLKKYITTVILGYATTKKLENIGLQPDQNLIVKTSKKEQIHVFLSKRADLITGNEFTLPWALQGTGFGINDVIPVLLMNERGYYLATNLKMDPTIIARLRKANTKIQHNGLIQKIINKYMTRPPSLISVN